MSDFYQNGSITTLPFLPGEGPDLEERLRDLPDRRRIALVLPALVSEFDREAMPRILEELEDADYLDHVVLSLDRANEDAFVRVRRAMERLPCPVWIVWNDGPRIRGLLEAMNDADLYVARQGKGRGVWLAFGFALEQLDAEVLALHDCDIVTYRRDLLARLVYPLASRRQRFEFAKGYYARANGRLNGRVTRLFYSPLIRAMGSLTPDEELLHYLDSFRYPLAGEFAVARELAGQLELAPDWGLEIATLEEAFEHSNEARICQVEIADEYDHKHQDLGDEDSGLGGMASDIARHLFRAVARRGFVLTAAAVDTLIMAYRKEARRAIDRYEAVAAFNGLKHARDREEQAAETFCESIVRAYEAHAGGSGGMRLQSWHALQSGHPGLVDRLCAAVLADNESAMSRLPASEQRTPPPPPPSGGAPAVHRPA